MFLSEAPCVIVNFLNFTFNKFSDYLPSPSHDESCKQIFCNGAKSLQKKTSASFFPDRKLIRLFSTAHSLGL